MLSEGGQKVVRRWSEGCDFEFESWNFFGPAAAGWCLVLGISLAFGAWNFYPRPGIFCKNPD